MTRAVLVLATLAAIGLAAPSPAQDAAVPIWIVQDEVRAPVRPGSGAPVGRLLMVLGVAAGVGAACAWRRRAADPCEAAFERLASRFGLSDDDKAFLRTIGVRERAGSPVSLLLSESFLRRALERRCRASRDPGERAHTHRIEALLLG